MKKPSTAQNSRAGSRGAGLANAKGLIAAAALIATLGGWGAISAASPATDQATTDQAAATSPAPADQSAPPTRQRQRRWQSPPGASRNPSRSTPDSSESTQEQTQPQPLARTRSSR